MFNSGRVFVFCSLYATNIFIFLQNAYLNIKKKKKFLIVRCMLQTL